MTCGNPPETNPEGGRSLGKFYQTYDALPSNPSTATLGWGFARRKGDPPRRSLALILMAALLLATVKPAWAGTIRAGAAIADITPRFPISMNGGMADRTATRANDRLSARCLVLDDGHARLAFVVCDSCMIPREVIDAAKARIAKDSGLPGKNVLVSATHTHTAPTLGSVFQSEPDMAYRDFLSQKIAEGVAAATKNLRPARVGGASAPNSSQVFNRRWKMKDGTMGADPFGRPRDRARMNPPVGSADLIEPVGPIDPEVFVLAASTPEGTPIAALANYSLHYVGDVPPGAVSADYFGEFADQLAHLLEATGATPPFVGIMSNGTSGDINNINFRTAQAPLPSYTRNRVVARSVAETALAAYRKVAWRDDITLAVASRELELRVRKPSEADLVRARGILEKAKGRVLTTLPEVYAQETVKLADFPPTVKLIVGAFRVGDVGVVSIPCEVFVEIGLAIKKKSPLPRTFTIELANGYNGYLPTAEQHQLGGYETWRARSSYLEENAATVIEATALELLSEVAKSR